MGIKKHIAVNTSDITAIDIDELLRREEDESFDRTLGGQESIGKKIASFGTKNGGLLLVGQDDLKKGGTLAGITDNEFQKEFTQAIASVKPTPLTRQKIIQMKGTKLALIQIQDAGNLRPCSYKGVYYERKGSSNHQLQPEEIKRYHLLHGSANAEDMPSHAKKNDIERTELDMYSKLMNKSKDNILQSVTADNGFLTVRGVIVLSARPENHLEGAFVEIQRYDNFFGLPPSPIGSALKLSKPARQLIEETTGIVEQNIPITRTYDGAKMSQTSAIPVSIIREAITNAVAHRNYRSHEHIRVRIYADGFDVSNPAVVTEKMWTEIQANQTTYHPNEGIYTFLNPARLYEGRGEGIWKIREEMTKLGKTAPEFKVMGEAPSTFYARISLSPAKSKDVKLQKLDELLDKKREITTTDVMKHLNVSRVTAISLLNKMVTAQRLEHQGSTRSSKYHVNTHTKNMTK